MLYAYDSIEQQHSLAGHPENAGRLASTLALLEADGILDKLTAVPVRPATLEQLTRVHATAYVEHVREVCERGGGQLDPDTYAGPRSYDAALASAGALLGLVDRVIDGPHTRGMSIMRPPGHHALADHAMGFCVFANVAVAARHAQARGLERVLVVDWDVHHGNGTEAILYEDATIGFFSTHQYPHYPGTGAADDIGRGAGIGATVNVPLPAGVADDGHIAAFERVLVPFAERFRPELVIVSAGFDSHWRDPLAQERVSLTGFVELQRIVTDIADAWAGGRLLLALEGGYDQEVLPHAILNALRQLSDPTADISDPFGSAPGPGENIDALLASIEKIHHLQP